MTITNGELPVNEWVACGKDGLLAHDPRVEVVNARVAKLGIKPADVTLAFIQEPGPTLVRQ